MRRSLFLPILLLLLLLPPLPARSAAAENAPRWVATRELGQVAIFPRHTAPATVISRNDSRLSSEIRAKIKHIPVLVGQTVAPGQTLVEFVCDDYLIALGAAEAGLELATLQEERARVLEEQQAVPREYGEQRRAELAAAKARQEKAALDVQRCRLSAPFAGIVLARLASEGEYADIGSPLLRLLASEQLEVTAQVPLDGSTSLAAAAEFQLEVNDHRFPLELRILVPAIDPQARNREARLLFTGPPALPGTAGRLVWTSPRPHLPADLVVRREAGLGFFVAEGQRARFISLPEAREGHPAALELPPATLIIDTGRHGLRDGDPIRIEGGPGNNPASRR
ncbi:efflux RND transporter periplasmic adaptor subunit [Desulfurivibrio sp. D14AmB]|uniref:efflux RND transporter periplasmic adaptor subunit n=1 Tax=Desulfurivibrio sp. D14AmB TaxID=3374370 RepID=UPI00376EA1EB